MPYISASVTYKQEVKRNALCQNNVRSLKVHQTQEMFNFVLFDFVALDLEIFSLRFY